MRFLRLDGSDIFGVQIIEMVQLCFHDKTKLFTERQFAYTAFVQQTLASYEWKKFAIVVKQTLLKLYTGSSFF